MSSLMARLGCRDGDLVVEAMAAWAPWARRMMPGGQVAQGGHDLGAVAGAQLVAVLIEDDVTDPVEPVLDCPVPAYPDLSCTVWVGLCFWMGFFVGMVPVGWSSWGTEPAVGSGG